MWFWRSSGKKISLRRGDTLGGSTSLLLLGQVKPAKGGRRFRRRRSSRFHQSSSGGRILMPLLLLFALGLGLWAASGLVDWDGVGDYLVDIRQRFTGD